ncbi:hypothetical protein FB45DRAFT_1131143 [Roridomyces roridus]|uniref:F-box domain-containing protein n=1 Tax=Roridomyces roridus TaxID=1738132 RepID=A0AAD7F9Y6_9AGAR|nr:hypothetical protein FB45DRAFT_1131143 [Roridomyces roridus]
MGHPLKIPELLDLILSSVDAPQDLKASALVCRSWALPSQSRLFSSIYLHEDEVHPRLLLSALQRSHLIRLIKTLNLIDLPQSVLPRFAHISFYGVHTLGFHGRSAYYRRVVCTIQKFPSSPALVSVTISCNFRRSDDFLHIWDRCSHTIMNLSFTPGPDFNPGDSPDPAPGGSRRIKFESFGCTKSLDKIGRWLRDPSSPFDISGLKAFQCNDSIRGVFAETLAPALRTIAILSLIDPRLTQDISRFRRLQQLDLELAYPFDEHFGVICTIRSEDRHHLQALQLHVSQLEEAQAKALAHELRHLQSVFSHIKTVHLRVISASAEVRMNLASYFAQLDPKTALHWEFDAVEETPWYTRIV